VLNIKAYFIEPMLLQRAEKLPEGSSWIFELKKFLAAQPGNRRRSQPAGCIWDDTSLPPPSRMSARMRCLYSPVKDRRRASATTSRDHSLGVTARDDARFVTAPQPLVKPKVKLSVIHFGHNSDLPDSVKVQLPDDASQSAFRDALNFHLGVNGLSEMNAYTKAWRAIHQCHRQARRPGRAVGTSFQRA
jgi:cation transport regulator ChaB